MANQSEQNEKGCHVVHCLLCQKPQDSLSAHLARVCMKKSTQEQRLAELQRAKESMKTWTLQGRNWNYNQMVKLIPDGSSRSAVVKHMQDRGFFVADASNEDMDVMEEPSTSAAVTRQPQTPAAFRGTTEVSGDRNANGDEDSSHDPSWQEPSSLPNFSGMHCTMQQTEFYDKFPSNTPILVEFKRYLIDHLDVLNYQQEVDNVSRMLRYIQPSGSNIDMGFLRKRTELKECIMSLKRTKLLPTTILNYFKNMIRFVRFLATRQINDQEFHMRCQRYERFLDNCEYHYRMNTQDAIVATANMLSSLAGYSSDESGHGRGGKGQKRRRDSRGEDGKETKDFAQFLEEFPVMLTGQPPTKKQRGDAGFPLNRCFYDKWRAAQFGKREEYLLSKFYRQLPTVEKVLKRIRSDGWTANHPHPEDIVARWRPPKKSNIEVNQDVMRRIQKQRWPGLAIKDYGETRGVIATRAFRKGSIMCDYHGELITAEEGRKILEMTTDEKGYLFFFSSGSKQLCINAQTDPCHCHPTIETMGRKMKHSRKNPNVKPLHCKMRFSEGEKDAVLLVAAEDIAVDEELRFDYGVNRKSFCGEGLDLEWLDE